VARVSLNMLRSRTLRREEPIDAPVTGPQVAEPAAGTDPEHEAVLADSVGLALLVVLETLAPPERLAFVLHDTFGVPFDEIATIVGRSPDAARQLASRARRRVQGAPAAPDAELTRQRGLVEAFIAALRGGAPMPTGPDDAVATARLIDGCYRTSGLPLRPRTTLTGQEPNA